jgi:hypothetical protein
MKLDEHKQRLWEAIQEYAQSCGGDTSAMTTTDRRIEAVAAVERAVDLLINPSKSLPDLGKTLFDQMKVEARKAQYNELWSEAILDGCSRDEAHRRAYEGSRDECVSCGHRPCMCDQQ